MASEIRVNTINSRTGLGTITVSETGQDFAGISTFSGEVHITTQALMPKAGFNVTAGVSTFQADISMFDKIVHTGDLNTAIRFPSNDTFSVETGGSERARIDSSGRLGIQGAATRALLEVRASGGSNTMLTAVFGANEGTTAGTLSDDTDKAVRMGIHHYDTDALPYALVTGSSTSGLNTLIFGGGTNLMNAATDIRFYTAANTTTATGTERLRITSDGKVGIGLNNPGSMLHVQNSGQTDIVLGSTNAGGVYLILDGDSNGDGAGSDYSYVAHDTGGDLLIGADNPSGNAEIIFKAGNNSEALRIDSSRRLLQGLTSARGNFGNNTSGVEVSKQMEGTSYVTSCMSIVRNSNDANDGGIILGKTRATSVGGNTVVQASDYLGEIQWAGSDGTSLLEGARIDAVVESGVGNDDMPTALRFLTNSGTTSPSERMRINAAGHIKIGSGSATGIHNLAKVLEISGGDGGDLIIGNDTSSNIGAGAHIGAIAFKNIDSSSGSAPHYAGIRCESLDTAGNMDLRFYTGTNKLESDDPQVYMVGSSLNVGTTESTTYPLYVKTTSTVGVARFESTVGTNEGTEFQIVKNSASPADNDQIAYMQFLGENDNDEALIFGAIISLAHDVSDGAEDGDLYFYNRNNGGFDQVLRIKHDGTFYGSSSNDISDQRLKENIATVTNATDKIKALKGRTFTWKAESKLRGGTQYGFIAQEVEGVVSDLVDGTSGIRQFDKDDNLIPQDDKALENTDEGTTYAKSVNAIGVVPILVEALKEAIAKIETLETKVAALESS